MLVVDDLHIEAANLIRLRKTLDRFLDKDVGDEDRVALVTTSGLRAQEFTDDRHSLSQVVAKLSPQERRMTPTGVPYITEYQAERIERGDPEALKLAVDEITAQRVSPNAEFEAKAVAKFVLAECIQNARATLGTLENVVRGMSALRGRKVAVLLSDGFLNGLSVDGSAAFDIRRITDAATRAGVIVYSLDSKGLVALSPGTSASSRMPPMLQTPDGASGFNVREQLAREGEFAIRNAMGALADDTGGFLVTDTNDLGKALRRALHDTDSYYLIAYEPAAAEDDSRFRRIEVRLPGVRGVRIRHRKGYFAGGGRNSGSPPGSPDAAADSPASPAADRGDSAMRMALLSPSPLTDIPLRLSADFVSVDAKRLQVVVDARVGLRPALFHRMGDRPQATFTVAAVLFDESGAVVANLPAERSTLDLRDAELAGAAEAGLAYQKAAPVRPGRYRVRVAVRDDGQGWVGNASQRVEAPDLADGKLILSSLFVFKEGDPRGSASAVAAADADGRPLRSVQAQRRFHREENLYVQFFAYGGRSDAAGAANLVTVAELWRDRKRLAVSAPEAMTAGGGDRPPVQLRRIGLRPFEPGDYELRMVVTEELSHRTASGSTTFSVE